MIPRTSEESFVSLFRDARKARKSEPAALAERRRVRLVDMAARAEKPPGGKHRTVIPPKEEGERR